LEKDEGPWDWEGDFRYSNPEFIMAEGQPVLLPIDRDQHANITILRVVVSEDGKTLTVFLKDTTYVSDPESEYFDAGCLAICELIPGEPSYVATVYHEWMIVENPVLDER
jgi:hypothetical protein